MIKGFAKTIFAVLIVTAFFSFGCGAKKTVFDGEYAWAPLSEAQSFSAHLQREESVTVPFGKGITLTSELKRKTVSGDYSSEENFKNSIVTASDGESFICEWKTERSSVLLGETNSYGGCIYRFDGECYADLTNTKNSEKSSINGRCTEDFTTLLNKFVGEEVFLYVDFSRALMDFGTDKNAAFAFVRAEDCTKIRMKVIPNDYNVDTDDYFIVYYVYDRDFNLTAFKLEAKFVEGAFITEITEEFFIAVNEVKIPAEKLKRNYIRPL